MGSTDASTSFDLSPQQRRLWLNAGEDGRFCAQAVIRIEGELEVDLLRRAVRTLSERHEILRTSFQRPAWSRVPCQVVADDGQPVWRELAAVGPEAEDEALSELFESHLDRPFDLAQGPLVTFTLLPSTSRRHHLLVRLPALCADDRSLENLLTELGHAYGLAAGGESEEPLQYADFTAWQHELLIEEERNVELAKAYWTKYSLAAHAELRLPGERSAGDPPAFRPRSVPLDLDRALATGLDQLAASCSLPLQTVLLASWEALLRQLIREPGIVVGRQFDGRKYSDLESGLGLYAQTLPVAGRGPGTQPVREFLKRVREAEDEAGDWQEYGVGESSDERAGAEPRLPFAFRFVTWPEEQRHADISFTLARRFVCCERFRVRLSAARMGTSLRAELEFDSSLVPEIEARRMAAQLCQLLASMARGPETPIAALGILSAAERQRLTVELNDSRAEVPAAATVQELFEAQAERIPTATAVRFEDQRLTYSELDRRANQLAHHLRALGVGPEDRVAIFVERSLRSVEAFLAVVKAGGAYVPLDPAFPRERLSLMLAEAGPAVLVTEEGLRDSLPEHRLPTVRLDTDAPTIARCSEEKPAAVAASSNLLYVLFTSGSTGRPKGVAIEHRQLGNYLAGVLARLEPSAGADFATVSTFAADLGNTMIYGALCTGGCLHVISQQRASNPEELAAYFLKYPVDYLKIVPSHLEALLSAAEPRRILPSRCLVLGGEASGRELIARLARLAVEGPRVLNHYGPTETTVGVTSGWLAPEALRLPPSGLLGQPLANSRIYLLDERLRPVVAGVAGELGVAGASLARGYLGRPAATAETFVPCPFGDRMGARLYRTGDRGRILLDGGLSFGGRIDRQVKIHGYRIELGEIETVLGRHPAIRELAVMLREDVPGDRRLVAYTVPRRGQNPTPVDLRSFLKDRLPDYMVPSAFVPLEALPLNPNGKLDRRALPAPDRSASERKLYVAPRTSVEETLAVIWSEVLGVENVGIHDSFFELGGDSILAIQVIARAHRAGLKLRPQDIFEHQTIVRLAPVVGRSAVVPEDMQPVTGTVPLTPIQRWFFEQDFIDSHHWNHAVLMAAREPLAPAPLAAAVEQLLHQHDALRLRFEPGPDGWSQYYAAPERGQAPLFEMDLSRLSTEAARVATEEAAAQLQTSLDLTAGPLMRAVLIELGAGRRCRLLLVIHHLVVDGVSWRILLPDLVAFYQQLASSGSVDPVPKTTSFGRWAERLVAHSSSPATADELSYWRGVVAAGLCLPVDRPGGENLVASGRTVSRKLDAEETRSLLQEVPTAYRTEINDALLSALALTVAHWTGGGSVALELEAHGREDLFEDVDLSRTVGWFTTRYPVTLELGEDRAPGAVLTGIKEQLRRIPRNGFGYGLLRYLSGDTELVEAPRPEIGFNYLGQLDQELREDSLLQLMRDSTGPSRSPRSRRDHLIEVTAQVLESRLEVRFSYSVNLHLRGTIEGLADGFVAALRSLLDHCRSAEKGGFTASDFPLANLGQDQLERIARKVGRAKG